MTNPKIKKAVDEILSHYNVAEDERLYYEKKFTKLLEERESYMPPRWGLVVDGKLSGIPEVLNV